MLSTSSAMTRNDAQTRGHGRDVDEPAPLDLRRLCCIERGTAAAALHGCVGDNFVRAGFRYPSQYAVACLAADLPVGAPVQARGAPHA
jgi:hypothetical protein